MATRVVTTSNLLSILVNLGHEATKVAAVIENVVNPPVPEGALKVGNSTHNNSPAVQAAQKAAVNTVDSVLPVVATAVATAVPTLAPVISTIAKVITPAAEDIAAKVVFGLSPLFDQLIAALKSKT